MNDVPMLLFLVVTAAPVLMNSPANPSSWSSSSAWSPASTSLRGLPAGTLQAWYDANNTANKVAFINFSLTASGVAGGNVLVTNNSNVSNYFVTGSQLQLGLDTNTYTVLALTNTNLVVSPNLLSNYNNQIISVASVVAIQDRSGNGRHLFSATTNNFSSPSLIVFQQVGYFQVSYYPTWMDGQVLSGYVASNNPNYATGTGLFTVGCYNSPAGQVGPWPGPISEIVVTNNAVNTNTRQQLEGYLSHKWGLANVLPTTHPYATASPLGFTPASLSPNLMQWYDSNNMASLFTDSGCSVAAGYGNTIGCWADQSGYGRNLLQSTSSYRPTLSSNALGGSLPALNATVGGTYGLLTSGNAIWLGNTNYSIAVVSQLTNPPITKQVIMSVQGNANNTGPSMIWYPTGLAISQENSDYLFNIPGAPLYNPNNQNGLPGWYYINNSNLPQASYSGDNNAALYLNNTPYAIAVVAQSASTPPLWLLGTSENINGSATNSFLYLWWPSTTIFKLNQWGDDFVVSANFSNQTMLYVTGKAVPTAPFVRINGQATNGTGSSYLTAVNGYFRLARNNANTWTGNIYETLVLTGNLKTAHLTMLEGYLAHKWGLQSQLPQNHPYRLVPPRK